MRKSKKGFTLVELLVVIAIIGILSSVVLVSLNSARQKARDSRRIADLHQIALALENYYDANVNYPTALSGLTTTYLATVPQDPQGTAANPIPYGYAALGSGTTCSSYHLRATLEQTGHTALNNDSDAAAGTACTGSAADAAGTDPIYDIKP